MTTKAQRAAEVIQNLARYGITATDAQKLRILANAMHRWDEKQCGDVDGTCIEYDDDGTCWETWETRVGPRGRRKTVDQSAAHQRRLKRIMARYPELAAYEQTDPRGCALYIYRKDQLQGRDVYASYSSVGCPVY